MSEQTVEAVALALRQCADENYDIRFDYGMAHEYARAAIAAHTKALVDGAGDVGKRLAQQMCNRRGEELCGCHLCAALVEAAATIAALRAEIDRAKEQGVRAGIEAAAAKATGFLVGDPANDVPLRNPMAHEIADAIRALDAAAIAKAPD